MTLLRSLDPRPRSGEAAHFGIGAMCALAAVVGVVTGLGALLFRIMISLIHNLLFLQTLSSHCDSSLFTPTNPWGAWVILVPVAGAVIVTFIVVNFAPEAKGHGVPEVMSAIYYKGGAIRPMVAAVKSIASAVAIGSGAAVGREGPIIQIGSALGSTFAQIIRLEAGQRITLVAAGAGAGIAATFNTPLGGVLFVTELMLPEVSVNTFLPVATATGIATFVGRLFFGPDPAFGWAGGSGRPAAGEGFAEAGPGVGDAADARSLPGPVPGLEREALSRASAARSQLPLGLHLGEGVSKVRDENGRVIVVAMLSLVVEWVA